MPSVPLPCCPPSTGSANLAQPSLVNLKPMPLVPEGSQHVPFGDHSGNHLASLLPFDQAAFLPTLTAPANVHLNSLNASNSLPQFPRPTALPIMPPALLGGDPITSFVLPTNTASANVPLNSLHGFNSLPQFPCPTALPMMPPALLGGDPKTSFMREGVEASLAVGVPIMRSIGQADRGDATDTQDFHPPETTLPMGNIHRLMASQLPAGTKISKSSKQLCERIALEVVAFITRNARDDDEGVARKKVVITHEKIISSIQSVGLGIFVPALEEMVRAHTAKREGQHNKSRRAERKSTRPSIAKSSSVHDGTQQRDSSRTRQVHEKSSPWPQPHHVRTHSTVAADPRDQPHPPTRSRRWTPY